MGIVTVPTLKMENEAQRSSVCSAEVRKEVNTRGEPGQCLQRKDLRRLLDPRPHSNGHREHLNKV